MRPVEAGAGVVNLDDPVTTHLRRDVSVLKAEAQVAVALAALRGTILPERIVYFYVEDEAGRLAGVVPTRRLLAADTETRVAEVMLRRLVTLPETATLRDAAEAFLRHRLLALPVVNDEGRLLGTIEISLFSEDFVALDRVAGVDDLFQVIGVHVARHEQRSPLASFRRRFPWLLANIAGGLVCAALIARHEELLEVAIVLALFMPVVLALAESVSIQSMTLTLQGLHSGVPAAGALTATIGRELLTSLLLGAASGGVIACVVWLWRGRSSEALVVGAAIALAMVTACLLGVALPTAVRAAHLDPKLAAGPFVLALADVAALAFYFGLGARFLE